MSAERSDLLQGMLDMLILKVVAMGPIHGYALSKQIQLMSKDVLRVQQGSLYPALHRLEDRKWLHADWQETKTGREAKYYSLTTAGRKQLEIEELDWARLSEAISLVMRAAES
jgi:PadR family transcriptional regulator PadR